MIFCWAGLVRGAFHLAGHFTASDTRAGGFLFWMLLGGGVCAYDIPLGLQITTPFSVRILGGGDFYWMLLGRREAYEMPPKRARRYPIFRALISRVRRIYLPA